MVLVFDGEEGGDHNTWEYLHVIDRSDSEPAAVIAKPEQEADSSNGRPVDSVERSSDGPVSGWVGSVAVGVAGLVIGAVVAMAAARLRESVAPVGVPADPLRRFRPEGNSVSDHRAAQNLGKGCRCCGQAAALDRGPESVSGAATARARTLALRATLALHQG